MKNYMMINGKKIEVSQETADNLEQEFGQKVTYSIGDRFKLGSAKFIIVGWYDLGVSVAGLDRGEFWTGKLHNVKDIKKITLKEIKEILRNTGAKRYWDSQKKVKCDT